VNLIIPFSLWPLRAVGFLGLILTTVGTGYGAVNLVAYLMTTAGPDSLHQLSATNWFFRGVTLLALAIVGEYVGRIYRQMNRQPQFIIRGILRRQFRR
jgi:undecaprenyl-phosphate 4-deoxy-4-formamido-L-arabinose transferase